jgi:DnaJ family protein C protein 19
MLLKIIIILALIAGIFVMIRRGNARPVRMPSAEARALLGVGKEANAADVREAHRRLIARVHPDTGGSAELATKVNAARDALLAELKRR